MSPSNYPFGAGSSIEESGGTGKKTSNRVEVEVGEKPAPSFTIEKLQRISGEFTKERLEGRFESRVQYEIIVKNTGNVELTFDPLGDPHCTGVSPSGSETVAVGHEQTYTCEHLINSSGTYDNEATIEDNYGQKETSNTVEVEAEPDY